MTSRRINPIAQKNEDRLKAIAGLLQKLTFQEMTALSEHIFTTVETDLRDTIPYDLLKVANKILEGDGK